MYKFLQKCERHALFLGAAMMTGIAGHAQCIAPSVGCIGNDRSNAFINSIDPNTIEYDNLISLFHSTLARQADGSVLVWGEKIASNGSSNVLSPIELNAANYPGLTGEILKFSGGSSANSNSQHFVLTTDGLFFWGTDSWGISSGSTSFQKLTIDGETDGLPAGVDPGDVKMLFGSNQVQALVTCSGAVYTLIGANSSAEANAYGDGSSYTSANNRVWHRVQTGVGSDLENVVAVRGNGIHSFIALTTDGSLYTWGKATYLGDGSSVSGRAYATQMTYPAGITPKMVGMTAASTADGGVGSSYYLLATNGALYAMGYNGYRQLGDYTTSRRSSWVQVRKSSTAGDYLDNVVWISPNEHDRGGVGSNITPSVNAITADTLLYAWGSNDRQMLGGPVSSSTIDPSTDLGGMTSADKTFAVETGGHTTMMIRKCSSYFGYVGHKTGGSMADGTSTSADVPNYSFTTSQLDICGASSQAATVYPVANAAAGQSYTMTATPSGGVFSIISGPATIDPASGVITISAAGSIEVQYEMATGLCPSSSQVSFVADLPLPVQLAQFTATHQQNTVQLKWTTAMERHNKGFEIQRSQDGQIWSAIGYLASQSANGSSDVPLTYDYTDADPALGKNYYRLRQIDLDGQFDYSAIRMVHIDYQEHFAIYPNPATSNIFISGLQKNDQIRIYTPEGKEVFAYQAVLKNANISIEHLERGVYYVEVSSESGKKVYEKIIKD